MACLQRGLVPDTNAGDRNQSEKEGGGMSTSLENMQQKQFDTWFDQRLGERLPEKLKEIEAAKTPSMTIIVTKGTLDWEIGRAHV